MAPDRLAPRVDEQRATIGARIRHERRRKGITLQDVSACTGLGVAHLSRIERGQRPTSAEQRSRIAAAIGMPLGLLTAPELEPVTAEERAFLKSLRRVPADRRISLHRVIVALIPTEAGA
ncbi:helix-turn-helix domain-containing protein [Methylobacterium segetis]|uniref:helix-turn-helix domain-containing protein n=1 Tax=Methylobacterium segetis TaxID=2488750 RepID=UPI00104D8609|nr:helix-turn-helix transcriptional regulator [Methylobacterium segetis]